VVEPLLRIDHLRVDFPQVVAVNDLCLNVNAGEVCGLIGPNGAGKTTTMRAVAGLQPSTRGDIQLKGIRLEEEPQAYRRQLGFMPDSVPVYEQLTAVEFLDHFARAFAVPRRDQRIAECLELTKLGEKGDALCAELSRGMKQRLVLAKTLLADPDVLLLDEPASGLDPLGRIDLRELLLRLRDAGKAVLVSSHILTELSSFCNTAAIMERGELIASGSIAELAQRRHRRRVSLRWRAEGERALALLRDFPGVGQVVTAPGGATFDFEGSTDALDELLRTLVEQKISIAEWRSADDDLEAIFLETGAKELM
jgi:ABC-2 type transport system ATP-binding protein